MLRRVNGSSKNRVREVQWQQSTEDLAILWHELHPTLQLGMQASTRKNKPKRERQTQREREREIRRGEETRPGVSTGGDQISALPQERSRAVSYPSGFQGCFLIACGVRAGWWWMKASGWNSSPFGVMGEGHHPSLFILNPLLMEPVSNTCPIFIYFLFLLLFYK